MTTIQLERVCFCARNWGFSAALYEPTDWPGGEGAQKDVACLVGVLTQG